MLRAGTAANAINAFIAYTPGNGVTFQSRTATGGTCTNTATGGLSLPRWLRLTRMGTTVTGLQSADGVTWSTVGSATLSLGTTANLGLSITAHNNAAVATGTFTSYSTTGAVTSAGTQTLARRYVYGSYADEPLALLNGSGTYYYATNRAYSIVALTDAAKNVVERYRYDTYGQQTIMAADSVTTRPLSSYGNPIGFTGRYHDSETALVFMRSRYLSTSLAKFLTRDMWRQDYGGPKPGDGYVNGLNLYEEYFAPNGLDPDGTDQKNCSQDQVNYKLPGKPAKETTLLYGPYGIKVRGGYQTGNEQIKGIRKKCCCSSTANKTEFTGRYEGEAAAWIFAGWYYYGEFAGNSIAVKAGARAIATASVQGNVTGFYDGCSQTGGMSGDLTLQGTAGIEGYGYAALRTFWGWEWDGEARLGGRLVVRGSGRIDCDLNQCHTYIKWTFGGELYAQFRLTSRISYTGTTGIYYEFPSDGLYFPSPVRWLLGP